MYMHADDENQRYKSCEIIKLFVIFILGCYSFTIFFSFRIQIFHVIFSHLLLFIQWNTFLRFHIPPMLAVYLFMRWHQHTYIYNYNSSENKRKELYFQQFTVFDPLYLTVFITMIVSLETGKRGKNMGLSRNKGKNDDCGYLHILSTVKSQ